MTQFAHSLSLLETAVREGVCPSAAVGIGVGDRLLARAVYGNACIVGEIVPADFDTRYDMASLTKILSTSMVAFRLIEEGRLRLHDTVGAFFEADAVKSGITVLQLMTHTSGLAPHIPLGSVLSDPREAVRCILDSALVCPPGSQVYYSCMGYILLGKILEQIGGAPLNELARDYVFDPLGMRHTGYLPAGGNIAATEVVDGSCIRGAVHDENARFLGGVSGNAGVFSDLADCTAFASMLACGGRLGELAFLSPAMFRAATRLRTPTLSEHRALGFLMPGASSFFGDLFPPESFGHTGFTGTSLAVDPTSGLYVVLLSNRVHPTRENTRFLRFRSLFHNAVMAEFSRSDPSGCSRSTC